MSNRTFDDVLDAFLERCEARDLEPATKRMYEYVTRSFLRPALGECKARKLKPKHFDKLYRQMSERGYVPSTIRKVNTTAGGALKHAERRGWVKSNAARLAELPRNVKPDVFILDAEQVHVFLDEAQRRDGLIHDYAFTMAHTGMRPGEACGLKSTDLDGCVLNIERSIDVCEGHARVKGTKTNKPRRITLDPQTCEIVRGRPGTWVFGNGEPARTDLLGKRFKRVVRGGRCHPRFIPRCFRHFHITQLLGANVPVGAVADRVGHANATMTLDRYRGYIPVLDERAATVIAAVMSRDGSLVGAQ